MEKKSKPIVVVLIPVSLLLSVFPAQHVKASSGWWDTNWQYRMKLT